jgi:hypothetical protein
MVAAVVVVVVVAAAVAVVVAAAAAAAAAVVVVVVQWWCSIAREGRVLSETIPRQCVPPHHASYCKVLHQSGGYPYAINPHRQPTHSWAAPQAAPTKMHSARNQSVNQSSKLLREPPRTEPV